jgi:Family of unknown function (DUF5681)
VWPTQCRCLVKRVVPGVGDCALRRPSASDSPSTLRRMSDPAENSDGTVRRIGRPFQPGQSGNPGGRPKGVARTVRETCGGSPRRLAEILFEIADSPKTRERDRIAAASVLFDRGWGKAPAYAAIEGADPLEQDEVAEAIQGLVEQLRAQK